MDVFSNFTTALQVRMRDSAAKSFSTYMGRICVCNTSRHPRCLGMTRRCGVCRLTDFPHVPATQGRGTVPGRVQRAAPPAGARRGPAPPLPGTGEVPYASSRCRAAKTTWTLTQAKTRTTATVTRSTTTARRATAMLRRTKPSRVMRRTLMTCWLGRRRRRRQGTWRRRRLWRRSGMGGVSLAATAAGPRQRRRRRRTGGGGTLTGRLAGGPCNRRHRRRRRRQRAAPLRLPGSCRCVRGNIASRCKLKMSVSEPLCSLEVGMHPPDQPACSRHLVQFLHTLPPFLQQEDYVRVPRKSDEDGTGHHHPSHGHGQGEQHQQHRGVHRGLGGAADGGPGVEQPPPLVRITFKDFSGTAGNHRVMLQDCACLQFLF